MRDNVYEEYTSTVHFTNRSGVRATCPDCHVPKEWGPKLYRKMQATKELYAKVFGIVDTPMKFEEHRAEMAEREWARMKANNSQECRNCHNFEYMDFSTQKLLRHRFTVKQRVQDKPVLIATKGLHINCHAILKDKKNFNFIKPNKLNMREGGD